MNTPIETKIITENGKPAFAVIPWDEFELVRATIEKNRKLRNGVPHSIIEKVAIDGIHPARAWREHLGLDQSIVAVKAGMKQPALARIESGEGKTRKTTLNRLALAMNLQPDQLDLVPM